MEEPVNARVSPSSSRAMRNIAEKQRRDKLNGYINELSTLVPTVAQAPRKLDKTSILRLAASYLRLYQNVPDAVKRKKEDRENIESRFTRTVDLLQTFDSFLVVLSVNQAKILHVTENVENLLSYSQVDMLGISFYCFVHPEDHGLFRSQILPHPVFETLGLGDSKSDQRTCCFRISTKGISRNEPVIYEKAILWGHCKVADCSTDLSGYSDGFRYPGPFRDSSRQTKSNDMVFVGVVKLLARKLPARLTLLETLNDEYITRHALDPGARIITTDHRISTVAGYLSDEVTGKSALSFMHPDDLPVVGAALRLLFMNPEGEGTITYRLIRCDGSFIYLRTRGHAEHEPGTKTIKSLICINTLLSEEEGKKALEDARAELAASLSAAGVPLNCSTRKASSLSVSLDVHTTVTPFVPDSKALPYVQPEPSSPDSGIGASDSERCVVTDLDTGKPLELVKSTVIKDRSNDRCGMWSNCTDDGLRLVIRRRGRPPLHHDPYKRCK